MRVGSFSVYVPEGRERDSGHVELPHGSVYTLRLGNHGSRRCDAEVSIDGKSVGVFRLNGGTMTLERPADDNGRFTFFAADSAEGAQAGAGSVGRVDRGLVQVVFRPERERPMGVVRGAGFEKGGTTLTSLGDNEVRSRCFGGEEKTSGGILGLNQAGVTGLTGQSDQNFVSVANLDYDLNGAVTISLRLVTGVAVRELRPVTRGNAVPAPVQ